MNVTAGYPADFIEIAHDIHNQTVHNLTAWTLDDMLRRGFGTSVTVGECLEDAPDNWYRYAGGAAVATVIHPKPGASAAPTKQFAVDRNPTGSRKLWMVTFFLFALWLLYDL